MVVCECDKVQLGKATGCVHGAGLGVGVIPAGAVPVHVVGGKAVQVINQTTTERDRGAHVLDV